MTYMIKPSPPHTHKLHSLNEWMNVLNTFKTERKRCETNCYMPLNLIEEYIEEDRLFYKITQDGTLWLFEREPDYYLGYYYVSKNDKLSIAPQDMDVVIYLIGDEKRYAQQREQELETLGCEKYRKNLEYKLNTENMRVINDAQSIAAQHLKKLNLRYGKFTADQYDKTYSMWRDRIDNYSVKYATKKRMMQIEEKDECLVIYDESGNLAASITFEVPIGSEVCFSENVAVIDALSNSGIGAVIFYNMLFDIFQRGCKKIYWWVWEKNIPSIKLTEKVAQPTGKFSVQMILKREGGE